MATVNIEEQPGETSPQEKYISTTSTQAIVLEGTPSSPDELFQFVHIKDTDYFPIQNSDEDKANQRHYRDAPPREIFVDPGISTPTISRSSTSAARTYQDSGLGVDITPPLSISR